jgi:hypothetical protein
MHNSFQCAPVLGVFAFVAFHLSVRAFTLDVSTRNDDEEEEDDGEKDEKDKDCC